MAGQFQIRIQLVVQSEDGFSKSVSQVRQISWGIPPEFVYRDDYNIAVEFSMVMEWEEVKDFGLASLFQQSSYYDTEKKVDDATVSNAIALFLGKGRWSHYSSSQCKMRFDIEPSIENVQKLLNLR